jgi:hypothetical protein
MKTIHKYPVPIDRDYFDLELPEGAEILTVQVQRDQVCLWCTVNTERARQFKHTFRLAGTGHELDNDELLKYIGTFQLNQGWVIGHLFEVLGKLSRN